LKWKQASDLAKAGDTYNAILALQELLKMFDEKNRSNVTNGRAGGVGAGAVIGTILLPGIGTIIGGAIGGLLGAGWGEQNAKSRTAFQAETNYRLGVIHEMMRTPAALQHYMQAKLLDPSHEQAAQALARLQPTIPVSPQLQALDDDL